LYLLSPLEKPSKAPTALNFLSAPSNRSPFDSLLASQQAGSHFNFHQRVFRQTRRLHGSTDMKYLARTSFIAATRETCFLIPRPRLFQDHPKQNLFPEIFGADGAY
jgi:hypothetical protein